ncbi:hypothetical protein ACFQH8_15405 [Halomicroarcula sp. GCM10025710]
MLDFEDITEGNYTFDVEVTDTDANASDTIEVVDTGDASASFQEGVVTENRGDVANITVEPPTPTKPLFRSVTTRTTTTTSPPKWKTTTTTVKSLFCSTATRLEPRLRQRS